MAEIQRYEMNHKGLPEFDDKGVWVLNDDHADIVAKKDTRISELELLLQKNAVKDGNEIYTLLQKVQSLAAENAALKSFHMHSPYAEEYIEPLPATEAVLREMRAKGVDQFAKHLRSHMQDGSPLGLLAIGAEEFASRIRSGEQP